MIKAGEVMMIEKIFWIIYQRIFVFLHKKNTNKKVLMIHKVDEDNNEYCISKENFEELIVANLDRFQNVDDFFCGNNKFGILLTFDDVFYTVYSNALPILEKYNVPYVIFINHSLINTQGYISTENIYEMINSSNCSVGSHGIKHDYKRKKNIIDFRKELLLSKKEIEIITRKKCDLFAFPYGSFYACGIVKFKEATKIFKYVFTTISMDYSSKYEFIPRYNINNRNWYKVNFKI